MYQHLQLCILLLLCVWRELYTLVHTWFFIAGMFSTQEHDIIIHFHLSCFICLCLCVSSILVFFYEISSASIAVISVTSIICFTCRFMIHWSFYCYSYDFQLSAHCLCSKLLNFFWRTLFLMILKLMFVWPSATINFVNTVNTCYRFRSY